MINRKAILAILLVAAAVPMRASAQLSEYYEQTYMSAPHNWAFRRAHPEPDRLFNAFDYGHAILYETLWTKPGSPTAVLDDREFRFITTKLLVSPPRVPLDEAAIGPEWSRLVPEVVEMFEWAHMLHRQIYDVWSDRRLSPTQRDRAVNDLLQYYKSRPKLAFSSLPKDMSLMESQTYSLAFRHAYPRFNGLIWSYHWLQMTLYDAMLASGSEAETRANVANTIARFRAMTNGGAPLPTVMPMSPAIAPLFSSRYPEAAVIFDNLHSLHDVVSDILADARVPKDAKRATILAAAAAYRDTTTNVTSMAEWKDMAASMGVEHMGGLPPIRSH